MPKGNDKDKSDKITIFSSLSSDRDALALKFRNSVDRSNYMLFPGFKSHVNECKNYTYPINTKSSVKKTEIHIRTDIESKLQSRNIPLNKENKTYFDYAELEKKLSKGKECKGFNKKIYGIAPSSQYSLLSHPKMNYHGIEYADKHILPYMSVDKQKAMFTDGNRSFYKSQNGFPLNRPINTREIVRNTHFPFTKSKKLKCLSSGKKYKGISNCTKINDH